MSEHISTRVENPHAPMHTGSGDLYVTIGTQLQDPDRPTFRRLADDHLAWLKKCWSTRPAWERPATS